MVVKDTTIPVITVEGYNPVTAGASNNPYNDLDVAIYDVGDPNVTINRDISGIIVNQVGTYSSI